MLNQFTLKLVLDIFIPTIKFISYLLVQLTKH
jgi:hypothetical protein